MDRRTYFDDLSSRWDGFTDGVKVRAALAAVLQPYAILPDEHIVDLGCGTGNLSHVLCAGLGPHGRVTAVDISPAMIDVAAGRLDDLRVRWVVADAASLPMEQGTADRVICFSAWPHFPEPAAVARELGRVLRRGGALHIVHVDAREKINAIHTGVGGAIGHDILPPATDLVALLRTAGFDPFEEIDAPDAYRVSARWKG
jgi:ubiquinone/menaquinone biosynthesis C-methylase UbiE